jgi:biopolymer transport protein ExbB
MIDYLFALLADVPVPMSWRPLTEFMHQGGPVLWYLAAIVAGLWVLVVERIIYLLITFPRQQTLWVCAWQERNEHISWYAKSIKEAYLSEAHLALNQNMNLIKVLVTLCPMLGLLGTVTGMINVFDMMALQGSRDPKLMASGISLATLPTMAGMISALTGLFMHARLMKKSSLLALKFERALRNT